MNSSVVDSLRHEANAKLDPQKKSALGQFMTPYKVAEFMANCLRREAMPCYWMLERALDR